MTLSDLFLVELGNAGALYLYHHFKGKSPAKALSEIVNLRTEIKMAIADALNELKTAFEAAKDKAVADAVAAATAPAVAAQEATDEQAVRDFTAANFPPAA
jgi:hypothetical protein